MEGQIDLLDLAIVFYCKDTHLLTSAYYFNGGYNPQWVKAEQVGSVQGLEM